MVRRSEGLALEPLWESPALPAARVDSRGGLLPPELARYVVEKGSIAVDGVSLTVAGTDDSGRSPSFTVSLIPETLARTTLGYRAPGEQVNLEVDVLAKYVERLLTNAPATSSVAEE